MGGQSFAVRDCRNTQYIEHRQLLLSLVFTPAEASERLAEIIGQDQVQGIRLPSVYSRLARITGPARHLIDDRISTRLGMVASQFTTLRLCRLAAVWSHGRDAMEPKTLAALLWVVLSSESVHIRKLAHAIAGELDIRARRAYVAGGHGVSSTMKVASAY